MAESEVERLRRQSDRDAARLNAQANTIRRFQVEVARLRAALAPFAYAANLVDEGHGAKISDGTGLWIRTDSVRGNAGIYVRDVRRARAAMANVEPA